MKLLVVDDAPEHAKMVVEFLRASGAWPRAEIATATVYDQSLAMLRANSYDVAVVDYRLGSRDGLALLRELREGGIDTAVVILTGHGAEDVAVEAMKAGAADYLSKTTLTIESLERAVRHALALRAGEQQRRQAEAALRASEERFRALVENSSDALLLIDAEARVTYITPSSERHLGWHADQMTGRSVFDFLHPDDREMASERMAETLGDSSKLVTAQVRFLHADGGWRIMEAVGVNHLADPSVGAIVVNARDITDRRKLEDQLRQSQKMEAVGQLAGGVAHDFNNLLTAILGYCNLVLEDIPDDSGIQADLEEIGAAGHAWAALDTQVP